MHLLGRFEHGNGEPGLDMSFHMAVEEAQHEMHVNVGHDFVPAHRNGGESFEAGERARFKVGALYDLKQVAVQIPCV